MKAIAIIQARMGSKRLPGKSLMLLNGKSLLANVIQATKPNDFIDRIVVVTSNLPEDNAIEKECKLLQVQCERGDAVNVLSRFLKVAQNLSKSDQIVRVTADNPINNPVVSKALFKRHLDKNADYTCVEGLSHTVYEYVKVDALLSLDNHKKIDEEDKEHVTKYIREHTDEFKVQKVSPESLGINSSLDKLMTIDTRSDYQRLVELYDNFDFSSGIDFKPLYKYLDNYEKA